MLVYKWMWDETSLRLQLNAAQMEALVSPSFMAVVREVGTARPSLKPKLIHCINFTFAWGIFISMLLNPWLPSLDQTLY